MARTQPTPRRGAFQGADRRTLIAGNWKMNLTHLEAIGLVQKLAFSVPEVVLDTVEVVVLPPFTALRSVQTLVTGDKLGVGFGAQDLSAHDSGAYTGEISGGMLAALACQYVTVGHSERRALHGEDDAGVSAKTGAALRHGLVPIVCVGEGLEGRRAGGHVSFCTAQLDRSLDGLTAEQVAGTGAGGGVVVGYQPGGTGPWRAGPPSRLPAQAPAVGSSGPTSRSGRSAPVRSPRRRTPRRSAANSGRGSPSGSARSRPPPSVSSTAGR